MVRKGRLGKLSEGQMVSLLFQAEMQKCSPSLRTSYPCLQGTYPLLVRPFDFLANCKAVLDQVAVNLRVSHLAGLHYCLVSFPGALTLLYRL
jgi:hypothetical protein